MNGTDLPIPGERPPVAKGFWRGTHRAVAPEETLMQVTPFLEGFGITRVANVTGLDTIGIPVVMVCRPNARSLSVSQGKGLTLAAAKASGILESIELWHAERICLPLRWASAREMRRRHRVVDVERLPSIRDSRFREDHMLLWIEGRDLIGGEAVWLPYECVHTDDRMPGPTGEGCFASTSNGLASGNDVLEAASHGICEVIERDATTIWRNGGLAVIAATAIDIRSVDDPDCSGALLLCEAAGMSVHIWDVTSDVGIPVFCCLIEDAAASDHHLRSTAMGMGCHLDRTVALQRAVTEAAQGRLTLIAGSRDDVFRKEYEDTPGSRQALNQFREARPEKGRYRTFGDGPTCQLDTFDADVALELDRLVAAGVGEVIAVNLTDPDIGIPVVRVVIPGLEALDGGSDYMPGPRALAAAGGVC